MFFVFYFLVFAYLTRSEINCFTQGTIRATNYVREQEKNSNLKGAAQFKDVVYSTNKPNADLKSNVFDEILTNEMLSVEQRHILEDSSENPLSLSTKHNLVTPTLELKQKWPMFKHINNVEEILRNDQNKKTGSKMLIQKNIQNDDDYLDPLRKSKIILGIGLKANKPFEVLHNTQKGDTLSGVKLKIRKPSGIIPVNKAVEMRTLTEPGNNCTRKITNSTVPSKSCTASSHNKKRCTDPTPNFKTHACSRYGVSPYGSNHSCTHGQQFQKLSLQKEQFQDQQFQSQQFQTQQFKGQQFQDQQFQGPPLHQQFQNLASFPYSFYTVYVPYSYFVSEPPNIPSKGHRQRNRHWKQKCKHRKPTERPEDDYMYYDDKESKERRPYDDNEYYPENKKQQGILYDLNQDALIKEIMNDFKFQNKKELSKKCYCNSSVNTCGVNIFLIIIALVCVTKSNFGTK